MNELYQTFGSGDLKSNASKAFKMIEQGPVVILARTQPKAVMVSPELWNITARRLAHLEDLLAGDEASARVAAGEYDTADDVDAIMSA